MARLPYVGGDSGNWGALLNDFLLESHSGDGTLKLDSVGAVQIKPSAVTNAAIASATITEDKLASAVQAKLNATVTIPVTSVAGKTGDVALTKTDVGLENVTNTSDVNKPISIATQTALDTKASSAATTSALALKLDMPDYQATSDVTGSVSLAAFTKSGVIHFRLVGNVSIDTLPASPTTGLLLTLVLTQDTTGSRTLTLPAAVKKPYGLAPALSTGAGLIDILHLQWDGTAWNVFVAGLAMA